MGMDTLSVPMLAALMDPSGETTTCPRRLTETRFEYAIRGTSKCTIRIRLLVNQMKISRNLLFVIAAILGIACVARADPSEGLYNRAVDRFLAFSSDGRNAIQIRSYGGMRGREDAAEWRLLIAIDHARTPKVVVANLRIIAPEGIAAQLARTGRHTKKGASYAIQSVAYRDYAITSTACPALVGAVGTLKKITVEPDLQLDRPGLLVAPDGPNYEIRMLLYNASLNVVLHTPSSLVGDLEALKSAVLVCAIEADRTR